jgi:hypothetical protein
MGKWQEAGVDTKEQARRVIDLIFVAVLLDAGVPSTWKYTDPKGAVHTRSEGLAIASFEMYLAGVLSQGEDNKFAITSKSVRSSHLPTRKCSQDRARLTYYHR